MMDDIDKAKHHSIQEYGWYPEERMLDLAAIAGHVSIQDAMSEKANNIVLGFVASTTASGAVPIPFADAPLLIGQQVAMMIAINSVFKFNIERDALTSLATAVIGVGGATVIGKTVASNLLKLIPGVGTVAGGAISAGTAGVITLALGKAYIEVCKAIKMGELDQSDLTKKAGLDMLKKSFKEQMKNSKK